jgi:hypothetical protein
LRTRTSSVGRPEYLSQIRFMAARGLSSSNAGGLEGALCPRSGSPGGLPLDMTSSGRSCSGHCSTPFMKRHTVSALGCIWGPPTRSPIRLTPQLDTFHYLHPRRVSGKASPSGGPSGLDLRPNPSLLATNPNLR